MMAAATRPKPMWLVLAGGLTVLLLFVIAVQLLRGLAPAPDEDAARAAERAKTYHDLQTENATKLQKYAWVDKAKGTVQIPIERAMELAIVELNSKRPAAAGPIATPAASPAPAAAPADSASPAAAPSPAPTPAAAASPSPAATPAAPAPAPAASPSPAAAPTPAPATAPTASPSPAAAPTPTAAPAAPPSENH